MLSLSQLNKKDFGCEVLFFQNSKHCKYWKKFIREGKVAANIFTPDMQKNIYAAYIPRLKGAIAMPDLETLLREVQDALSKNGEETYDDKLLLEFINQKPSYPFMDKYFSRLYIAHNPLEISEKGGYCMCFNCQSLRKNYLEVLNDSMSLDNPPCMCNQCRENRNILKKALAAQ